MSTNRTKLIATVLVSILLFIFGCIGMLTMINKSSEGQSPIRRMRITIDVNRREELFTQLQKFADKHDFVILIRDVEVIPDGIFIKMDRNDLEISARDVPDSPTNIDLGFYEKDPANPTPADTVDDLFNDLVSFISEIPNVVISDEN